MSENNESHEWSKIQETGTFFGLSIMLWIYRLFGVRVMYFVLYFVSGFYFIFGHATRKASMDYLTCIHYFMGNKSPWRKAPNLWISYHHFLNFSQMACDKIIVWLDHYKPSDITLHGYETYDALRQKGQGSLLLVSHLGNIDLCRAFAGSFKNIPLTVLVHNGHAPNFFRLMQKVTKRDSTIELIEVQNMTPDVIIRLQDKIAMGGSVAIAADRTAVASDGRLEMVSFLGLDAAFAQGPFYLADLLDCPVFNVFAVKQTDGYHAYFSHVSDTLKTSRKNRPSAIKQNIQNYAAALEKFACDFPLQWFNFYDYWAGIEPKGKRNE